MTRFPPIPPEQRTPAQIAMAARAPASGPFEMYQRSPALWETLQPVRDLIAERFTLRQREIAVLAIAAHWQARNAIASHTPIARRAGLTEPQIQAILANDVPDLPDDDARLLQATRSLVTTGRIADDHFAQFPPEMLVNLTGLIGFYTGLALVLNLGERDGLTVSA